MTRGNLKIHKKSTAKGSEMKSSTDQRVVARKTYACAENSINYGSIIILVNSAKVRDCRRWDGRVRLVQGFTSQLLQYPCSAS